MRRVWLLAALLGAAGCVPELGPCDESAARRVVHDQTTGSPAYEGQALMITSCSAGGVCHAPDIDPAARNGVPVGLDYDVSIVEGGGADLERLQTNHANVFAHRYRIWEQVVTGAMPPRGALDEGGALDGAPEYARYDSLTGEASPLPRVDTEEGAEILRNWLSCRSPVVERTEPSPDTSPIGAVVSRRDVIPLEPAWPDIYERMIAPRCATLSCHGESLAGGLDLRGEAEALAALVSTEATSDDCAGAGVRIVPGDPDASLFVHKLSGRDASGAAVCGDPMPVSGRIDPQSIENIRQWIADGAAP